MLSPKEVQQKKDRLAKEFREFPGGNLPPERCNEELESILKRFIDHLRTKGAIGFSDDDVVTCRLIQLHHWTVKDARGLQRSDWPIAMWGDWQSFLDTLEPDDREFLLVWQYDHGCFVEHITDEWRRNRSPAK